MKIFKDITVIGAAILAIIYIINPTAGFVEFIPDNFPIIGNLDEAGAVLIIVSAFRYFGVELADLFNSKEKVKKEDRNVIKIEKVK
ncbi:MAG: DUF1232 domain-containing protein [Sphingobacteriales bacterium]|jgi:uncharacterized membrane protein YkvA (DUF1232 family)|nr:MAG: DUF1232 domain-containing protein [Sphingobacteriales bacterium]